MCAHKVAKPYTILENALRFDLSACDFKKLPGEACPWTPLDIACSACCSGCALLSSLQMLYSYVKLFPLI